MQALGLKFEASSSIQDNLDDITGVVSDDIIGVILEKNGMMEKQVLPMMPVYCKLY